MVVSGNITAFLLGGQCRCRISNTRTGNSFEYKIKATDKEKTPYCGYYIQVKDGGEFKYAGFLRVTQPLSFAFYKGAKGVYNNRDMCIQALLYILTHANSLPECVLVEHLGVCGRCGRKLTDETSILRGIGPECYRKIGMLGLL